MGASVSGVALSCRSLLTAAEGNSVFTMLSLTIFDPTGEIRRPRLDVAYLVPPDRT